MLVDRQGRCLKTNTEGLRSMGLSKECARNLLFRDIWPEEERERIDAYVAEVLRGKAVSFDSPRLHGGEKRWWRISLSPARDEDGTVGHFVSIGTDITAQRRREDGARESVENLLNTLNSIGEGFISTGVNGEIIHMNPLAEQLTGWDAAAVRFGPLSAAMRLADTKTRRLIPDVAERAMQARGDSDWGGDFILYSRHGTERRVAVSGAPIRKSDGRVFGAVLTFRDVTERHRMSEQLRHGQKMESIGLLAGGVAHDFNNMLSGIIGYAELIQKAGGSDEKIRRFARIIVETSERAGVLTSKLLSFSRKGTIETAPVDVHDLVEDSFGILRHSLDRKIDLRKDLGAKSSIISADHSQMQAALLNLCVNARDAMPQGGSLTVTTENVELDSDYCRSSAFEIEPGTYVLISVRDSGTGMNEDVRQKIFDPFFTTKGVGEGTGLGLSAVYGTVKEHDGEITVFTEEGRGTVFHLRLPVMKEPAAGTAGDSGEVPRGSGSVLVIDDEKSLRYATSLMLQNAGYEVLLAEDGYEGVEVFRRNRETITAVVMDMVMPRMNGRECFRAIRDIDPDARIVMFSGFVSDSVVTDLLHEGLVDFLKKPFRGAELIRAVHTAAGSLA